MWTVWWRSCLSRSTITSRSLSEESKIYFSFSFGLSSCGTQRFNCCFYWNGWGVTRSASVSASRLNGAHVQTLIKPRVLRCAPDSWVRVPEECIALPCRWYQPSVCIGSWLRCDRGSRSPDDHTDPATVCRRCRSQSQMLLVREYHLRAAARTDWTSL